MRFILLLAFLCVTGIGFGQPKLLKNFDGLPGAPTEGSNPNSFFVDGNTVYFSAYTRALGGEFWKTDVNTGEVVFIKDIIPGVDGSGPTDFARFKDHILFSASSTAMGIWQTDGTAGGTVKLFDHGFFDAINSIDNRPRKIVSMNDQFFFFFGYDQEHGYELWKSDGTQAGTVLVSDINPGAGSSVYHESGVGISGYCVFKDELYFYANDGVHGAALWKSNGTAAGTVMIKDGVTQSDIYAKKLIAADNYLFFSTASKAWRTDGTASGSSLVPGNIDASYMQMIMNNELVFINSATWELYKTNGSSSPAPLSNDLPKLADVGFRSVLFKGSLYATVDDPGVGFSIWKYDGTNASRVSQLFDEDFSISWAIASDDNIFFNAYLNGEGELWKTNGTQAGTEKIVNVDPYFLGWVAGVGKKAFFILDNKLGNELWVTDGTEIGTSVTEDINKLTDTAPFLLQKIGDIVYFRGYDPEHGFQLWKTDGTTEGTVMIKKITPGDNDSAIHSFVRMGNKLVFIVRTNSGTNEELWQSDGTEAGTKILLDSEGSNGYGPFHGIWRFNEKILFSVSSSDNNAGLWISDGTEVGTERIDTNYSGTGMTVGDKFFYFEDDLALRITDGTSGGTLIKQFENVGTQFLTAAASNHLYFFVWNNYETFDLWVSDGTPEGTKKLKQISTSIAMPNFLGVRDDEVFFTTFNGNNELWSSDGTESGTIMLKDINPGEQGSNPAGLSFHNDKLYFSADDGEHGGELWTTDGTAEGTQLALDVIAGPVSSSAFPRVPMSNLEEGNRTHQIIGPNDHEIYIRVNDRIHGSEFWVTDGTQEKTRLLFDLMPGAAGSVADFTEKIGNRFLFLFNDYAGHNGIWYIDARDHWINFDPIPDKLATDESFEVFASSSAAQPLTLSIVSGPATVDGKTITPTGVGPIVVRATAEGNSNYDDPEPVERTFTIIKAPQEITFEEILPKKSDDAPFPVIASSTSELPVSFTIDSGPATVDGNTVTLTGAGTVSITARQEGNSIYEAAPDVTQTFTVEVVLGLEDPNAKVYVFPNPVTDRLFVQSAQPINSITLFDVLGRSVVNSEINNTEGSVAVDHLVQGMYVLRLTTRSTTFTTRIYIKR